MRLMTVTAALLLTIPATALAQTPQERLDAARQRAAAAGLPASLIEVKIAEGMAKGIPMERLAAAVDRREAALERAYAALSGSGGVDAAQLSVGADAIGAGVSEAVLTRLSAISQGSRRAVAIAALTQLVVAGQLPQRALDQVTAALARGGDALANLPAQAAEAAARRGPPEGIGRPESPGASGSVGQPQVPVGPPAGVPGPGQKPGNRRPGGRPGGPPGTSG